MRSSQVVVVFENVSLKNALCISNFFLQAEDGIRDLVRSRGLGDVYKRQRHAFCRGESLGPQGGTAGDGATLVARCGTKLADDLSLIHI